VEGRGEGKEEKNCSRKKRDRQEFKAREISKGRTKTARYRQELLATIELLPPRTKIYQTL